MKHGNNMKRGRTSFIGWLAALLTVCLCATAAAQDQGSVVTLRGGTLERLENGAWRELAAGRKISAGERLRTGKDAVAVIEFPGVGRYVMGPASEIEMGREPKHFTTRMDRGALWLKASLPAGSRAAISTPPAIAGVRGTAFSMVYGEDGRSVCACTCTGKIEVTTPDGARLTVPRGRYVAIGPGESAPARTQPSAPLLDKTGTVFDYCQACHVAGGKGRLKADRP